MNVIGRILNRVLSFFGLKLSRKNNSTFQYKFSKDFDYSLVMIGAHNGSKSIQLVHDALKFGKVCLVEPVPYLFKLLSDTHSKTEGIHLINKCITPTKTDTVDFYAISLDSNKVHDYGDQLGSLNPYHAKNHDNRFEKFVTKIKVPTLTTTQLLDELNCSSVNFLFIDTEGHDAQILLTFPFNLIKPKMILFEHKHADGTHIVGDNFVSIIKFLNSHGYQIRILDSENAIATLGK
jgi:FkbM family methyltransferase